MDETIQEVQRIIEQIKEMIKDDKCLLWPVRKNNNFLREIGWLNSHALEYVCDNLCYQNYSSGPEKNKSKTGGDQGFIWVFGICLEEYKNIEVYIKFHIKTNSENEPLVCMSFHEAEYPMTYPLKGDVTNE